MRTPARPRQERPQPRPPEDFAAIIRDLSEPETGPHADNLMTNEDSFPRVCGEIARQAPPGGTYLGVGPDQNFSYVAHARPSRAFVVDFRRRNVLLHLLHKALFSLAANRREYLSRLLARAPEGLSRDASPDAEDLVAAFSGMPMDRARLEEATVEVARFLEPLGVVADDEWPELATMHARLASPGMQARFLAIPAYPTLGRLIRTPDDAGNPAHIMATESLYQHVRAFQMRDGLVPLVGDFAGEGALPRLSTWLIEHEQHVSVLYVSDVEFFLLRAGRFPAYVENLARLPWAEGSLLIRTSTRPIDHPERVDGDSSTTIVRPVAPFLDAARAGTIRRPDDLFEP